VPLDPPGIFAPLDREESARAVLVFEPRFAQIKGQGRRGLREADPARLFAVDSNRPWGRLPFS